MAIAYSRISKFALLMAFQLGRNVPTYAIINYHR